MPTTINPSDQSITQYALQVGAASNLLGGISAVATGQVLASGGVSTNPSYTAYPQVTGIGVGASPGSTTGLTFDGSNFLATYVTTTTWTPTLTFGGGSTGITYNSQYGNYLKIGNLVFMHGIVNLSSKGSSTGNALITLPFTAITMTVGKMLLDIQADNLTFPVSTTYVLGSINSNSNSFNVAGLGTVTNVNCADTNFANNTIIRFSGCFLAST